jgi:hypothetical protein
LEDATTTKDKETEAEFGSMKDERNTRHALRPAEGQDTSMHPEEPQRVTDDDSQMTPLRGEYEEDNDDESWHNASEDGWETAAYGKAKDGAGTEPEGEAKCRVREEEVGNRHVCFGWDAIRMWIGRPRRDRRMNEEKARDGDPLHLIRRPRQFGCYGNIGPRRKKVAVRGRRPQ